MGETYATRKPLESRFEEIRELKGSGYSLREISEMTGLAYGTVKVYSSKLRDNEINREKLNSGNPGKCPECGAPVEDTGSEIVCTECGLVVKRKMSFGEGFGRFAHQGSPAPESKIVFGKSLGNTLYWKNLYRVLPKLPDGKQSKNRVYNIKRIVEYVEHPTVQKLLKRGSRLLKEHGFSVPSGGETRWEHVFADEYGRQLRFLGGVFAAANVKMKQYKRNAAAVLYLTLKKFDAEKAEELRHHLEFTDKRLRFVSDLLGAVMEVKKNEEEI